MLEVVLLITYLNNCYVVGIFDDTMCINIADDTGAEGKDLLQGRHLMTQLKDELRNETGITK